jgi:hypothetical protein
MLAATSARFKLPQRQAENCAALVACSHNATNALTDLTRAAQIRMMQASCLVAGSFFAVAIVVASDATSQRAAVTQKRTDCGRSLRFYRT